MMRPFSYLVILVPVLAMGPRTLLGADDGQEYYKTPAYKMLTPPQGWYDLTPVYKEPQLLLYTQEFTYKCSQCHESDLKTKPKKSHLPFGAHEDMFFTHGLNLRCLNCHNVNNPDAFVDHDGSVAVEGVVDQCRFAGTRQTSAILKYPWSLGWSESARSSG